MKKFRKSAGVILKHGDEVLLCKRGSKETLPNIWSIPGGGIENGESPGQAAIREFHEETDIEIKQIAVQDGGAEPYPEDTRDPHEEEGPEPYLEDFL